MGSRVAAGVVCGNEQPGEAIAAAATTTLRERLRTRPGQTAEDPLPASILREHQREQQREKSDPDQRGQKNLK